MAVSVSKSSRKKKRPPKKVVRLYKWQEGSRAPAKYAEPLGRAIEEVMDKDGCWDAQSIVDKARPKSSPIHGLLTWDDSAAAEMYRCTEVRAYARQLHIVVQNDKRVEYPIAVSFGRGKDYQATERVLADAELRERLLALALKEAQSWRQRYKYLAELGEIFAAIDKHL